jgi:hypothetical protein
MVRTLALPNAQDVIVAGRVAADRSKQLGQAVPQLLEWYEICSPADYHAGMPHPTTGRHDVPAAGGTS